VNRLMRKLIILILTIALLIPAGQAFAADTSETIKVSFAPIHYVIDGVDYAPPETQLGFITSEGNTYVPLRFVASILNKTVAWDGPNSKVTVAAPTSEDWKTIRDYLSTQEVKNSKIQPVDKSTMKTTSILINTREVSYEFNGKLVQPNAKTPGLFYNSSIYVPLRFIYESLGYEPSFNAGTYLIETNTDADLLAYQTIVKANDKLIVDKKAACEAKILPLALNLMAKQKTLTADEKQAIVQQAEDIIVDCRSELDVMLDTLTKQLTDAGQSTDVVSQYLEAIVAREAWAREQVKKFL
jgi:hypothetical protein